MEFRLVLRKVWKISLTAYSFRKNAIVKVYITAGCTFERFKKRTQADNAFKNRPTRRSHEKYSAGLRDCAPVRNKHTKIELETPLQFKLYGPQLELERTAHFVLNTGLTVWPTGERQEEEEEELDRIKHTQKIQPAVLPLRYPCDLEIRSRSPTLTQKCESSVVVIIVDRFTDLACTESEKKPTLRLMSPRCVFLPVSPINSKRRRAGSFEACCKMGATYCKNDHLTAY